MLDDKQILELIQSRKTRERGFRELVTLTKEKLYWQIRKMVFTHEDADDLLQEVYIKVFRGISSFKGDSSLTTWVYRIAYNETINFLKSKSWQNKLNDISLDMVEWQKSTNGASLDANKLEKIIQKAIAELPDKQRAVFTMRYYNEVPFKEMEQIMQTSESALKTSYHIAEKKIKEILLQQGLNF
jgi:RNA polymerase sigma factor (sigma-70 family)